jgi:uncharacterized RmlC-like cupin family protein
LSFPIRQSAKTPRVATLSLRASCRLITEHRNTSIIGEDEAFYILDGEFEIECGGQVFKASPGTFALLPKGLPHRFQNLSDKPGKVLCVQSPSGIEEFVEHMSLLAKAGPPDLERMKELAGKYEIEFLLLRR